MKKIFLSASIGCLLTALIAVPTLKAKSEKFLVMSSAVTVKNSEANKTENVKSETTVEMTAARLYDSLKLYSIGLPQEVLTMAYKGQQHLSDKGRLDKNHILAICDFSQNSKKKRLYIIDTRDYRVLMNTYVAHGKNSGLNEAERFSNIPESLQSSLGFYVTKGTYFGKHGLSLRMAGVEPGFNDKAESRAIVVHGANYIGNHRLSSSYMGRSFGCPAVPQEQSDEVINYLKNGTCLFIYHPTKQYLHGSKILNG